MSQNHKGSIQKNSRKDVNEISGEVGGKAVIVQGADARVNIRQQEASPSEIRHQAEMADLVLLKHTISLKVDNLKKHPTSCLEKGRNPFNFGQPLKYRESELLMGRESALSNILGLLRTDHTAIIAGNGGSGKTSLLQAGVMPQLVKQGDLPVIISVSDGSLETKIKREFLGEVTQTLYLSQIPLSTFLRHVTECIPQSRHVHILVDQFEDFLSRTPAEKETFKQEWALCMSNLPRIHWVFSIHLGFSHLLNFFRPDINPFGNLIVLSPLDRQSARDFITRPASICGFSVEEPIIEDILDRLGNSNIDPGQLQKVCYILAGGNGPAQMNWTMAAYMKSGRADGVLSQSLDQLIGQLKYGDRRTAWQILATLAERGKNVTPADELSAVLRAYNIQQDDLERLIRLLEEIHLVDIEDDGYRLSSQSILPRINQWLDQQTALVQARQEAMNQVRQLRNSALRGMVGGALGFLLFDQLVYTGAVPDLSFAIFFITHVAAIGGISGFLLTLTIDLSIAAYHGSRFWLRYLTGGFGGMVAFAIGFALYANNNYAGDNLLRILPSAALEGGVWGGVIGLGTTHILGENRHTWLAILATVIASGLVLFGMDTVFSVLVNENWAETPSVIHILLAGSIMPFCYILGALFRRPLREKWN